MNSNRTELERLDRDTLIARAEQSGVARARILTRPELIDEILTRASSGRPDDLARVRGLFGRARDLLARVVERGLHLPDAADRLRGRLAATPLLRQEAPLPTVTLAEIYAAQGHRDRAVDTLKDVLDREPEHSAARALIERLQDAAYAGPEPAALPPEDEIFPPREGRESADPVSATRVPATLRNVPDNENESADGEAETIARDDECVAIPVDRETLFVHWQISDWTRGHLTRARPRGVLVLRVLVVAPTWDGPDTSVRDTPVRDERGDAVVRGLPEGAVLRAMIGWSVDGALVPIAHSPALEALERDPEGAVETVARWTSRGVAAVEAEDRDAGAIERAFGAMRARARAREIAEA